MAGMQIDVAAAGDGVEEQYVEMMVPLYSYGCERKIKKALSHLKGIYSVNVDFRQQKVTIWGICSKSDVLSTIKSKRKGACLWPDSEDCPCWIVTVRNLSDGSHRVCFRLMVR